MTYTKLLFCFLTAGLLMTAAPVLAAPTFDSGGLGMQLKELVQRESRTKLLKAGGEYVKTAQAVMGTVDSLKKIAMPMNLGTTPLEEWSPVVPKNVAKVLKEEDPKLADVRAEIEKIAFLDKTTPDSLKLTKRQQGVLLLKILAYSYAASERSLELSTIGYEENEAYRERVEKELNVTSLYKHTAVLQMFSTRKISEILNLQSRMLEMDSMRGLINREKPTPTNPDEKKDETKTESSGTDTPTKPDTGGATGGAQSGGTPSGGTPNGWKPSDGTAGKLPAFLEPTPATEKKK